MGKLGYTSASIRFLGVIFIQSKVIHVIATPMSLLTQATCVLYCDTILNSILRSIIAIRIPLLWIVNVFMRFSATKRLTYHFIGTPHTHHIIAINKIFLVTIVTPGKISDTPLNPSNITLRATVFYFLGSGDLDCYSNLFIWHILEHIAVRLYK